MSTFNKDQYIEDSRSFLEAKEFANNLSNTEIEEIYSLINVSGDKNASLDQKRESIRYMKFYRLKLTVAHTLTKDSEFEALCDNYRVK